MISKIMPLLIMLLVPSFSSAQELRPDELELTIFFDDRALKNSKQPLLYVAPMWSSGSDARTQKEAQWLKITDDGNLADSEKADHIYTGKTRISKAEFVLLRLHSERDTPALATLRVKMPAESKTQVIIQRPPEKDAAYQFKNVPIGMPLPSVLLEKNKILSRDVSVEKTRSKPSENQDSQNSNSSESGPWTLWTWMWSLVFAAAAIYSITKSKHRDPVPRLPSTQKTTEQLLAPPKTIHGLETPRPGSTLKCTADSQIPLASWLLLELGAKGCQRVAVVGNDLQLADIRKRLKFHLAGMCTAAEQRTVIGANLGCIHFVSEAHGQGFESDPQWEDTLFLRLRRGSAQPSNPQGNQSIWLLTDQEAPLVEGQWKTHIHLSKLVIESTQTLDGPKRIPLTVDVLQGD